MIVLIIISCCLLVYLVDKKTPYKFRMWFWAFVFFLNMFNAKIDMVSTTHPIFNTIWFWICLIFGFWHLTKACFFIDEKELLTKNKTKEKQINESSK